MTQIILDGNTAAQLRSAGQPAELCDPSGKVVGRFRPRTEPEEEAVDDEHAAHGFPFVYVPGVQLVVGLQRSGLQRTRPYADSSSGPTVDDWPSSAQRKPSTTPAIGLKEYRNRNRCGSSVDG